MMSEAVGVPISSLSSSIDQGFADQVTRQVARITAELNTLDQLLTAGMVDRRVLIEFRDAVNRVRSTSWNVQNWMEAFGGGSANLASMLLQERIRIAKQVSLQLSSDLMAPGTNPEAEEIKTLQEAIAVLHWTLIKLNVSDQWPANLTHK